MMRNHVIFAAIFALCSSLTVHSDSSLETITVELKESNSIAYGEIGWAYLPIKDSDGAHRYYEEIHHYPHQQTVIDTFFLCPQQMQEIFRRDNIAMQSPISAPSFYNSDGMPLYSNRPVDCIISGCVIDDPQKGECVIIDVDNDEDLTNDPVLIYHHETTTMNAQEYDLYSVDTEALAEFYDGTIPVQKTVPVRFRKRVSEDRIRYEYKFSLLRVGTIVLDGQVFTIGWPFDFDCELYWDGDRWISSGNVWIDLNRNGQFEYDDFYESIFKKFTIRDAVYQCVESDRFATYIVLEKLDTKTHPPVAVGLPAPVFSAKTLDGNTFDLAAQRSRYVLLDFWGSWCGPCIGDVPYLKEAHERFGDKMCFVGIAVEDDRAVLEQCIAEHYIEWTQVHKMSQDPLPDVYQIEGYPSLFLISPDGTLACKSDSLRGKYLIPTLESYLK